jgi:hypothetical protein
LGLIAGVCLGTLVIPSRFRLEGQQPPDAPPAIKTIADLVTQVQPSIGRVSIVREFKAQNTQLKKEIVEFFSENAPGS